MAERNYYDILGVDKNATEDDIKKAFRQKVKETHPDANPDDPHAEEKFKEVNEAYQTLRDEEKKAAYDRYGHDTYKKGGMGGAGGGDPFAGMGGFEFDLDLDDILSSFFGMGGTRARAPRAQKGADIQTTVTLTLEEVVFGVTKELTLPLYGTCPTCDGTGSESKQEPQTCPVCNGSGQEMTQHRTPFGIQRSIQVCSRCHGKGTIVSDPCGTCHGDGYVQENKTIKATFPKGFDDGMVLKIAGKGHPGTLGGPFGDLLVVARVLPHKMYTRRGNDLYAKMDVSYPQAALGDSILVPTIYGDVKYTLPAGTQSETERRFKGKGVQDVRREHKIGDLYVTFHVTVPTKLDKEQKEALEAFAKTLGDVPKEEKKGFFERMKDGFDQ